MKLRAQRFHDEIPEVFVGDDFYFVGLFADVERGGEQAGEVFLGSSLYARFVEAGDGDLQEHFDEAVAAEIGRVGQVARAIFFDGLDAVDGAVVVFLDDHEENLNDQYRDV